MTKHKLWVISELFHPVDTSTSFIMTRIADYMSDYFNVHVLTGPAKYDTLDVKNDEKSDRFEFEIHRVNVG
uniref:hypothetical protein n=1 Tax=Gracilibacillus dipsosauri TaxID=178340 RepID=UPI00240A30BC